MLEVDLPSASRFLDALGGPETPHTFLGFPEGGCEEFPLAPHGLLTTYADALTRANRAGCGISVRVNATDGLGAQHENFVRPRALFIDIDPPKGAPDERVPLPNFGRAQWPSAIVKTRRGWHCYWWLSHDVAWGRWELAQAELAERFAGDPRMADRTKALRVPGFWHHKSAPPILVELEHCTTRRWRFDEIVESFRLRLEPPPAPPSSGRRERPSWVLDAIDAMPQHVRADQYAAWVRDQPAAVEGSGGHDQLVRVIKMAHNFGVEWDVAWPVVEAYNDRCAPPWDPRGLRSQFRSAQRGRFDPDSWESMLWAPERPTVVRAGVQPPEPPAPRSTIYVHGVVPDDVPPPEDARPVGSRVIRRSGDEAPGPSYGHEMPPLPEEPPEYFVDAPGHVEVPGERSGPELAGGAPPGRGSGGSGGGGGGGTDEGPDWRGPPINGHRILDPNAPLESAKMFLRWRHVRNGMRTLGLFRRAWYGWDGERYQSFSKERINRGLYAFGAEAKAYGSSDKNGNRPLIPFNPSSRKVNDMRHALESLVFLDDAISTPCWISESSDPQPPPQEIVACANGLLHLPTGEFLGRRPDYFNLTSLGVDYDPAAPEPERWLRFLEDLWPDDRESQRLLQEWFGLCLVPDTSYQKALLIVGPKRSGKGTIARVLNALHGAHNSVAWPSLTDLVSRFGLQGLLDKTVAIMPDLRVSGRLDTQQAIERFLQITGEDWVQVDRKNLPMVQTQIPVRFLLLSNLPPRLPDAGGAFASRVVALHLERSFLGHEDRFLLDHLVRELPGILRWSIEGWSRLRSRGYFQQPATGAELLEELAHLSNPIQAFVENRCELEPNAITHTDELFVQWRKWCEDEGRTAIGEKSTFVRNIRAAYPELQQTRRRTESGNRARALVGLRIVYEDGPRIPSQQGLAEDW